MRHRLTLCLALQFAMVASADVPAGDVVAMVDGTTITRAEIRCGVLVRDNPAACHRTEQHVLQRRIFFHWIDAAARLHHLTLTKDEEAQIEKIVAADREGNIRAAEHFHALAVAILRIRKGEDRASVYNDASRHGLSIAELDQQAEFLPTLAIAERTAAKDFVAEGERALRESQRRDLLIERIQNLIQSRATGANQSFDEAATAFWSEIAKKTHTAIVDTGYQLPDPRLLLRRP